MRIINIEYVVLIGSIENVSHMSVVLFENIENVKSLSIYEIKTTASIVADTNIPKKLLILLSLRMSCRMLCLLLMI